jgi:hypothetical protein
MQDSNKNIKKSIKTKQKSFKTLSVIGGGAGVSNELQNVKKIASAMLFQFAEKSFF